MNMQGFKGSEAPAECPVSAKPLTERQIKRPVLRRLVVAAVFLAVCTGIIFNTGMGTVSSFGWELIASICPLGALEAMLSAKSLIPQGLVFILIAAVALGILGKFFCSWICPIPSIRNLIDAITHRARKGEPEIISQENNDEPVFAKAAKPFSPCEENAQMGMISGKGRDLVKGSAETAVAVSHCAKACGACAPRAAFDSRHLVLGGSLLSAAIFGFPVFCLVCPIGLTFASIIAVVQLFGDQTLSWGLLLFPLILILELTILRKWCSKICPMGALASLLSLPNRLFCPKVNREKCLRSRGVNCQICTSICPEELDPHLDKNIQECSKCRDCAINCPVGAISFPFWQR
jgi:ferredoxin-type protein NapH